jgi:FMN-dependent NADH-azoreductase
MLSSLRRRMRVQALRLAACLSLILLAFSVSSAEVYRYVDSEGNVVYSDRPQNNGAEVVELNVVTQRMKRLRARIQVRTRQPQRSRRSARRIGRATARSLASVTSGIKPRDAFIVSCPMVSASISTMTKSTPQKRAL